MSGIGELKNWNEISRMLFTEGMEKKDSPCLLIGNGASIAVSENFSYDSLYEEADLLEEDKAIFEAFGTTDFEFVLRVLSTAKLVNERLGMRSDVIEQRHDHIRESLAQVVGAIHLENCEYEPNECLGEEFLRYKSVYSTNYDLLLYWSLLSLGCVRGNRSVDMFYENQFNWKRDYGEESTKIFYLHGALHLYLDNGGNCRKLRSNPGERLLNQIRSPGGEPIHFVSEGTWQKKREAIRKSVYLQYVFDELNSEKTDMIIFGSSFKLAVDNHIIESIKKNKGRRLAISVWRGNKTDDQIVDEMDERELLLRRFCTGLLFFDAATHPLGAEEQFKDPIGEFKDETETAAD